MEESSRTRRPGRRRSLRAEVADAHRAVEFTDFTTDVLEDRISALEEIAAARWPRRSILRRRLARSLRASVAGYASEPSFVVRRSQVTTDALLACPRRAAS